MAVSGSGTQADPYIVSTWAEFLSVVGNSNKYVKWADGGSKTIEDTITISTTILCDLTYCDFNGWTFKRVDIAPANINLWAGAFRGKITQAWNLHIERLHFSAPQVGLRPYDALSTAFICYNWYIDKVTEEPLEDETDNWWRYNYLNYSDSSTTHFNNMQFWYSKINCEFENLGTRIPAGEYHFCNLKVKYTYDLQDGEAKQAYNDIFPKNTRSGYAMARFYNCYVYGKIDVSDGVGSFSVINPQHTGGGMAGAGTYVKDTIINLETIVGEDCTIKHVEAQNNPSWNPSGKSYFVCNNGNNFIVFLFLITCCRHTKRGR